jgi:hypothetical protein
MTQGYCDSDADQLAAASAVQQQGDKQLTTPLHCSLIQVVRAPALDWLQSFFADLRPELRQVGHM